ncbi:hypothetical protein Clacol_002337 [Clathrus columnatus]|uniref:Uncharacterized protein n=1 Tax=Clathrus columnatus TaxID=1419009 RepID=A0AAV5A0K4_9AGAM|nr:hypothetical protein Clacol_002337 [Clathrus columnatus]
MVKTFRSISSPLPGIFSIKGCPSIHICNLRNCTARKRFKFKLKHYMFKSMHLDQAVMYNGDPENPEILNDSPIDDFPLNHLPLNGSDLDHLDHHHTSDSPLPSPSSAPTPTSALESPLIRGENHDPEDHQPGPGLFRKLAQDGAIYFL